jgi:hypothetical protein
MYNSVRQICRNNTEGVHMRTNAKSEAKNRIEQQESAMMLRENEAAATLALEQELRAYIELLALNEGLSDNQVRFLAHFAQSGIVSKACIDSGIGTRTHYDWILQDAYKEAFEEAKRMSNERLEILAYNLASGVFSRPIASAGKVVAYEPIYDTRLLQSLMKARMPEKYAQKVDITSNGHSLVKIVDKEAWDSI